MKNILNNCCEAKLSCIRKKNSTKEKIMDAAFSLYKAPRFKDISLQEVADICGITKAAIFRHYKSKEDLIQAMNSRFVDVTCPFFQTLRGLENFTEVFEKIFLYFVDHFEYLAFFMKELLRPGEFENHLYHEFKKRNINTGYQVFDENRIIKNKDAYVKIIYSFITVLHKSFQFAHNHVKVFDENKGLDFHSITQEEIHELSEKIYELLKNGEKGLEDISELRKKELEKSIEISEDEISEENKIFSALAFVIHTYGFVGVTVERVASELGLAKSSLYTYFSNKNTMMKELISDELIQMINYVNKKTAAGKSYSEKIYLHMFSQLEYLINRKSLLPVMSWISIQENMDIKNPEKENTLKKFMKEKLKKTEGALNMDDEKIVWISMLPVTLMVQGIKHGFKVTDLKLHLRNMFRMMTNGIEK
jgi:AcrR family transcriptional regulator